MDNTEGGKVDTYNIYDDYGNLVMVIPPDAIVTNEIKTDLVFTYKYNNKNLLCEKKIPGAEKQVFYYDNRDLLVMSQDGNMRAANPNKYLATTYDEIGRQWQTGFMETATPEADLAAWLYKWVPISAGSQSMALSYTYYLPNTRIPYATNIAAVGNRSAGDRETMFRSVNYNAKGEKEWSCPEYLRYNNCEEWAFNTDGTLKTSRKYNNGPATAQLTSLYQVFYSQRYEYDHARRSKSVEQQLWGPTGPSTAFFAPWTELSAINYNYKDQVIEKNIGRRVGITDAKALQSIDYQYNQRGWLTGINQTKMASCAINLASTNCARLPVECPTTLWNVTAGDDNVDLFGEKLGYSTPIPNEYVPTMTPQYNGNIAQLVWEVAGREAQAYTFTYDDLDRLTNAYYSDINEKVPHDPCSNDNKYQESLTYDLRGNVKTLYRRGLKEKSTINGYVVGNYGIIDDMDYIYDPTNKNRVTTVIDKADPLKGFKYSNNNGSYTYDANGNLKSDPNKGITNIVYNYLNLPETIFFDNDRRIEFIYDATGMKLRKSIYKGGVLKETRDYMDGFEYVNDKIDRIAHAEGYLSTREKRADENNDFVGAGGLVWQYYYTLKDHLGNTRVTFADLNNDRQIVPNTEEVSQINHYYPFGMNMDGNWNGASPNVKNKYQYNEKELITDFGLDLNDYGARSYDGASVRFTTLDPLAEMYSSLSGYHYVQNNPIKFIDPTGMASEAYNAGMMKTDDRTNYERAEAANKQELDKNKTQQIQDFDGNKHTITSSDINSGASAEPYGFRTEDSQGNVLSNTIEGYNINKSGCGCPNPPCPNQIAHSESISAGFALGGGFGIEFGTIRDNFGNSQLYFRLDARVGLGFGAGLNETVVTPNAGKDFRTSNWAGTDVTNALNFGPFGASWGGDTKEQKLNSPLSQGMSIEAVSFSINDHYCQASDASKLL